MILQRTNFKKLEEDLNNGGQCTLGFYDDSNDENGYYSAYIVKNDNHYTLGSSKGFISREGFLSCLKKEGINNVLLDIRTYTDDLFKPQFKNPKYKEYLNSIIEFKNTYTSTNGSGMTLIMLNLNKIKLEQLT